MASSKRKSRTWTVDDDDEDFSDSDFEIVDDDELEFGSDEETPQPKVPKRSAASKSTSETNGTSNKKSGASKTTEAKSATKAGAKSATKAGAKGARTKVNKKAAPKTGAAGDGHANTPTSATRRTRKASRAKVTTVSPAKKGGRATKSASKKKKERSEKPLPQARAEYCVEISKSGRAECKRCNKLIPKSVIRVGEILEGDFGLYTRWLHLGCAYFTGIRVADHVKGFSALDAEQKAEVTARVEETQDKVPQDMQAVSPDECVRKAWCDKLPTPRDIKLPLLPYQEEGLAWMVQQEKSDHRGGILADEMGMGKTLQTIATMVENRPGLEHERAWEESERQHGLNPDPSMRCGTLVICPVIALLQWRSEIEKFTHENALKVVIYHGQKRTSDIKELRKADVVLTTYSVVQADYSKVLAPTKITCSECGKRFYPDKFRLHRKYFCGASAQRTSAQSLTQRRSQAQGMRNGSDRGTKKAFASGRTSKRSVAPAKKKLKTEEGNDFQGGAQKRGRKRVTAAVASSKVEKESQDIEYETSDSEAENVAISTLRGRKQDASSVPKKRLRSVAATARAKAKQEDLATDSEAEELRSLNTRPKKPPGRVAKARPLKVQVVDNDDDEDYEDEDNDDDDDEDDDDDDFEDSDTDFEDDGNSSSAKASRFAKGRGQKKPIKKAERDEEEALPGVPKTDREIAKLKAVQDKLRSPVMRASWFRIVLDEAHVIKDRSTATANAVFGLMSLHKWCLTGTPLQNRVSELYSLIRFLRMDPHGYYFCKKKGCDCKRLEYDFGPDRKACTHCGHTPMLHFAHFNKFIMNPIKRSGYVGEGRSAMLLLKDQVLNEVLLRRTKATRLEDIALPQRIVKVRQLRLDAREEDFYQALYTQSKAQFATYVDSETVLHNYAHIFDLLMRMRQAVDHPYLVIHSSTRASDGARSTTRDRTAQRTSEQEENSSCPICNEEPELPVLAACGHAFCRACAMELIGTAESSVTTCPVCQSPLTVDFEAGSQAKEDNDEADTAVIKRRRTNGQRHRKASIMNRIDLSNFQTSTKMEALVQALQEMQAEDSTSKALVFSQFVNMLDLLEYRLRIEGIGVVLLSGHLSVTQRKTVLDRFQTDPDCKVLLMSLKAGGVALNLVHANHVFIMDPWWNPAAEMQAIDRTHRMGQHKTIWATRFILENTIEERIVKLQDKKRLVFDGTVGSDNASLAKLTVDDMRFLFQ